MELLSQRVQFLCYKKKRGSIFVVVVELISWCGGDFVFQVKYCSENNKRLIHFSTCEVYGKTIGSFLPKDSSLRQVNFRFPNLRKLITHQICVRSQFDGFEIANACIRYIRICR